MTTAEATLYIGWASQDITPDGPVLLHGQYYERRSAFIESKLTVTACAIESLNAGGSREQAIMVSADLLWVTKELHDLVKVRVASRIPDFNVKKLFINVTHTHSAPDPGIKTEYGNFLIARFTEAVIDAWNSRKPSWISDGLGYAVVGHNRRVQYSNGTTEMYGEVNREDFMAIEGPTDPGVGMIFCWNAEKELTGIIINVCCPAQVTEAKYFISADYWGQVRKQLKDRFSKDIYVLAQCGAAGDISPRDLPRGYKAGEPNMWDIPGIIEIGKRLTAVIEEVYSQVKEEIATSIVFKHTVIDIDIPTRVVSEEEYHKALEISTEIHSREPKDEKSLNTAWNKFVNEIKENEKTKEFGPWDNKNTDYGIVRKMDATIEQYKNQKAFPFYRMELHVIRLGDIAIASNSFELFVDYGLRISGRSKARQTFIVQLACDYCDYLPTERALRGGGYSAMANPVGPEGGKVLVDETVDLINAMWK